MGFGAQHLIRDVISGFFILAEGLIQVGDVISVGEHQGQVERISIRTTQVRKYSGELWTIPNGQITVFGNASRGYMRAIVDIPLSYRADVDRAMTVMRRVADEWAAAAGATVLSPPEVHSVLQFGDTRIVLRLTVTVSPGAQIEAERELRRRLKAALDREAVGSPFIRTPEGTPSESA